MSGGGGEHREVVKLDNYSVAEFENYTTMSLKNMVCNSTPAATVDDIRVAPPLGFNSAIS